MKRQKSVLANLPQFSEVPKLSNVDAAQFLVQFEDDEELRKNLFKSRQRFSIRSKSMMPRANGKVIPTLYGSLFHTKLIRLLISNQKFRQEGSHLSIF